MQIFSVTMSQLVNKKTHLLAVKMGFGWKTSLAEKIIETLFAQNDKMSQVVKSSLIAV